MNQPALYHKSHRTAKDNVGNIIEEYFPKLQWRLDGKDALIDVGSGPGDVLMDFIYPLMPENFTKIVCSDISEDMVEFAKSYYCSKAKCEFFTLDIATKEDLPAKLMGQFDHVTSMLCLHWVQDYKSALRNIFNLLRPEGGDCLLVFMSSHTIFDAYNDASKHTKWSKYLQNVNRFISPLHYSTNAIDEFAYLLEDAGFEDVKIEIKTKIINYGDVSSFKENVKSVCGALDAIPASQHSEFLDDFVASMSKFMPPYDDLNKTHALSSMKYDLLVAYGKKKYPKYSAEREIEKYSLHKKPRRI